MRKISSWEAMALVIALVSILGFGMADRMIQTKSGQFEGVLVACANDAQLATTGDIDCASMFNANTSLTKREWIFLGKTAVIGAFAAWLFAFFGVRAWQRIDGKRKN